MKKLNKQINYKAYDGNYYAVMIREWPKEQGHDYLIKTYGYNVPFPIKFVGCTWKSKQWKFMEIKKVEFIEESVPVVRIGEGKSRCPYCWERKCLLSSFSKDIQGINYPETDDPDEPEKLFKNKRFIGQCLSIKNKGKYFIAEYRESYRASIDMLVKKQCPLCKSHGSLTVVELKSSSPDSVFIKGLERGISEEAMEMIRSTKGIRYNCDSCNANEMLFFRGGEKNKYFAKIKEAYFKK